LDLGKNFQNAFDFAKRMTEDAGKWIILIILSVIPIINFVTIGYASKVIKESPASRRPPKLEKYVELWVQGLKVIVALIIYMIIPLIIFGLGAAAFLGALMGAGLFGMGSGKSAWAAWPMAGLAGVAIIIGVIVTFLIAIVAVMGIAHMIKKNQFGKAFAFKEITNIIGRIGWGNYILWLIVLFVINLIYGAIGRIPWIGWIITLVLIPPYVVFISRSIGITYSEQKRPSRRAPKRPAKKAPKRKASKTSPRKRRTSRKR